MTTLPYTARQVLLASVLVVFISSGVLAVPISKGGALLMNQSPVFDATLPAQWDLDALISNGSIKNENGLGNPFIIRPGEATVTWTGNLLQSDLSGAQMAEALFLGGGTLTIQGTLRQNTFPGFPVVSAGTLLVATVGPFHVREIGPDSNTLGVVGQTIKMTPTGGFLFSNATLQLQGVYELAMIGATIIPDGGGSLSDFGTSFSSTTTGLQMTFNLIPEPASLLLVLAGLPVLYRKGRAG